MTKAMANPSGPAVIWALVMTKAMANPSGTVWLTPVEQLLDGQIHDLSLPLLDCFNEPP